MRVSHSTTFILLLFVSAMTFGQETETSTDSMQTSASKQVNESPKRNPEQARAQINQLLEGALLIRLKTKSNLINALREKGNDKLADKIEIEQRKLNMEIVAAFKTLFDFCPVYFFYSDGSQNIRDRKFDEVEFISENLSVETTIIFTKNYFLTAEFGIIEGESAFGALIIKDDQFSQLKRPFPYYVRTYESLPIRRSVHKTVLMMNRKLHEFY